MLWLEQKQPGKWKPDMPALPAPGFAKHPDHTVAIAPQGGVLRAMLEGQEIACGIGALRLSERGYPERFYFPREDVDASRLVESGHTTYCPFKGTARYWHLKRADGEIEENAAWAYDDPFLECASIAGFVAFYSDKVTYEGDGR
jgi:uncharacterized protein (DUF427 family)